MKPIRWRRLGLVGAAALIATAGLTLVAEPALAVPGRVVVTATTVTDSTSPKSGFAACPAGTVPLGGGGAVKSAVAGLTIVQDNPTATGWIFAAIEQGAGTNSDWSLTTWAVCAPAPTGYQVITASGTITPPAPANASCPAGKKLTGAGAVLDTPVGDNVRVIESIRPNSTLSTVSVSAKLDPGALSGPASNAFTSYAVCINQLAGQQLATANSATDSSDKTVTATCPFPTVPFGVGATIRNGAGQVNLTTLRPDANPALVAAREHAGGYAADWTLQAFAICLR